MASSTIASSKFITSRRCRRRVADSVIRAVLHHTAEARLAACVLQMKKEMFLLQKKGPIRSKAGFFSLSVWSMRS